MRSDTIAAISTAVSEGGIGIIRVSGPGAFRVADRIFVPGKAKTDSGKMHTGEADSENNAGFLSRCASHTIHYGSIVQDGTLIDEVLVSVMRAPRTYTAEDTVEINCHGGICAMQQVLKAVLASGARSAEPGEFTKRAFLNGRIDLSRAEAVMDVIQSKNRYALLNSVKQVKGALFEKIEAARKTILTWMAEIEAALDDPEHISLDGFTERIYPELEQQIRELSAMADSFQEGRLLQEGIRTVIVGKPNAGKSSLLNLLVGEERAIVTDIEGTTRDVLQETINLDGITLHMVDTAGIRESDDRIEQIGVEKARQQVENADLVLYVADASRPFAKEDEEILKMISGKRVIILLNKTDLPSRTDRETLEESAGMSLPVKETPVIEFSVKTKAGYQQLKDTIQDFFFTGKLSYQNELMVTNERQAEAVREAVEALGEVRTGIMSALPEDFLSIDMRTACEALGRITGESVSENLVEEIFSKFCMGK